MAKPIKATFLPDDRSDGLPIVITAESADQQVCITQGGSNIFLTEAQLGYLCDCKHEIGSMFKEYRRKEGDE